MTKKASTSRSKSTAKTGSATTSRTGQKGADETTVTPVEDANDKAASASKADTKAGSKEAPARKGHAVGVPRKTMAEKFGSNNPEAIAEAAQRKAVLGI